MPSVSSTQESRLFCRASEQSSWLRQRLVRRMPPGGLPPDQALSPQGEEPVYAASTVLESEVSAVHPHGVALYKELTNTGK